jgi:hypothetical protein
LDDDPLRDAAAVPDELRDAAVLDDRREPLAFFDADPDFLDAAPAVRLARAPLEAVAARF